MTSFLVAIGNVSYSVVVHFHQIFVALKVNKLISENAKRGRWVTKKTQLPTTVSSITSINYFAFPFQLL